MANTDRHGFLLWSAGFKQADVNLNDLLLKLEVKLGLSVIDRDLNAPAGGESNGDCYIVGSAPSGAWASFSAGDVVILRDSVWYAVTPISGWGAYVEDEALPLVFNGSAWIQPPAGTEFSDSALRITDNADATKKIAFEASGIATGTTRTLTMPDRNLNLGLIDSEIFTVDIPTVADQDYDLWLYAPFAGTITAVGAKSASGTCTLTAKIGSTALGGTANSVTSTYAEQAHSTSNAFVKGDVIRITISANSSCLNLAGILFMTRTS